MRKSTTALRRGSRGHSAFQTHFSVKLDKDDDWTLVIKLQTMIEGGLIHLLLTRLEAPRLAKAIARLETGNQQTGKHAFVNAFELLSSAECRFIRVLCELRNITAKEQCR